MKHTIENIQKVEAALALHATVKNFKKGDTISKASIADDKIYYIKEGRVKLCNNASDKEIIKSVLTKGDIFGEEALIGTIAVHDTIEAMEALTCYVTTVATWKSILDESEVLSHYFIKSMEDRKVETENRMKSLLAKDSKSRIKEYLFLLTQKSGQRVGFEWVVYDVLKHQDIASLTFTSRQTVTTVLNELRDEGIIAFNRKRLLIRNLEALQN